jgi:hypothetical protein
MRNMLFYQTATGAAPIVAVAVQIFSIQLFLDGGHLSFSPMNLLDDCGKKHS